MAIRPYEIVRLEKTKSAVVLGYGSGLFVPNILRDFLVFFKFAEAVLIERGLRVDREWINPNLAFIVSWKRRGRKPRPVHNYFPKTML